MYYWIINKCGHIKQLFVNTILPTDGINIIVIDTWIIIIFDEGVWVRMVLVRLQQLLTHGHGTELNGKEEYDSSVFGFDNG